MSVRTECLNVDGTDPTAPVIYNILEGISSTLMAVFSEDNCAGNTSIHSTTNTDTVTGSIPEIRLSSAVLHRQGVQCVHHVMAQ